MDAYSETDPVLRRRISGGTAAIVPVGSIEQHGAHLPVSTDSEIVGAVASGVGRGSRFLVMPTITTGVSFEHAPFFNISVRSSTLESLLGDICDSLHANGIQDVFIINGHYSNRMALESLVVGYRDADPRIHAFSYWRFMRERFDHGGFVETSLMLAVSGTVRMSLARRGLVTEGMDEGEVQRLKSLAAESFPAATGNGIWGDPRRATAEDGRRLLREIVRNLRRECLGRTGAASSDGSLPRYVL